MPATFLRIGIIGFWAVMILFLTGRDFLPGRFGSGIPIQAIPRMMFEGGQMSRLGIFRREVRVGDVDVQTIVEEGVPTVTADGSIGLALEGRPQRWHFGGHLRLRDGPDYTVKEGAVWVKTARAAMDGSFAFNRERNYYHLSFGLGAFDRRTIDGTADEVASKAWSLLDEFFGPTVSAMVRPLIQQAGSARQAANANSATLVARRLPTVVGEAEEGSVEVLLESAGEVQARVVLSALGGIVRIDTPTEYRLVSEFSSGLAH